MRYVSQFLNLRRQQKERLIGLLDSIKVAHRSAFSYLSTIKNLGVTQQMTAVERSKLGIFNQLNFFQFITGILVPVIGMLHASRFPIGGWVIVCLPALVSVFVLVLNYYHKHELGLLTYFVL